MKHNYSVNAYLKKISFALKKSSSILMFAGILMSDHVISQTYTFTPCGATGAIGPTQLQANGTYIPGNSLNGSVTISGQGIQQFTVPTTGIYRVEARGAMGYSSSNFGGRGAIIAGDFNFIAGDVLKIVAGQTGSFSTIGGNLQYGGGGGSFVTTLANTPLVIAGGGGGSHASSYAPSTADGTISANGNNGAGTTFGAGGTAGAGGAASSSANGGAGLTGNGGGTTGPAIAFTGGAQGGNIGGAAYVNGAIGGFGGGGGTQSWNNNRGGGGGGYSGGGGGQLGQPSCWGGGGGSFNAGTAQSNTSGANTAVDGLVIISALCNISLTSITSTGLGPICAGSSATITTNAISNYVWNNGANTSSIVVSPAVTTSYTLTATSPSNCTASAVITITVNPGVPTLTAVSSSSAVCAGNPVTLTASGAVNYTWSTGSANGASYLPASTAIYTVTGVNACGTSTAAVGVTVNAAPTVTASVNTPTVCNGGSVIFTGGGNATSYIWSAGVVNNVAYFPGATNNYTLTGTANNCSSSAVVGVTVLITPVAPPIATQTAICIGSSTTLSAVGATGYTWTPGPLPNTFSVSVSPTAPTTYTLSRTNGACSSTATIFVMVNPIPGMNATGTPNQICAGTGVNLNVIGAITYTWMPGGFTSSNFTVFPNGPICYTVTGSNGSCTAVSAVCVTVNPSPVITISAPSSTLCEGSSMTLNTTGATNFTWSSSPQISNNPTEVVSPGATTIITVSGTNAFGCSGSASQLLVVHPLPSMSFTSTPPFICATETAVIALPAAPNVVYNWTNGPSGNNISVNPPVTTTYSATGTNTATGCTNSGSYNLAVYISTFVVSSPTAICIGQTATMTATGPASNYSWTSNNAGVISNSAASVTVSPLLNTTYTVTGTTGNCSNKVVVPVIVNPLPNVTASVDKATICRFEIATIKGNGATTYTWNNQSTSQILTFTLSVTNTYTLTGTDNNGCSKTTTVTQYVATCPGFETLQGNGDRAIIIYPNPNNGHFTISADVDMSLTIVNAIGQVVDAVKISADVNKEVSLTALPSGIYLITGESNGLKVNKKIIIQK